MKINFRSSVRNLLMTFLACMASREAQAQGSYQVTSNHVSLRFADQSLSGVTLESITELQPIPNVFPCSPPLGASHALWRIEPENQPAVEPSGTCIKSPISMGTLNGYSFTWPSITIAPAPEPTLKVEMLVAAFPGDRTARWWISVQRNTSTAAPAVALMKIHCPILWLDPLIAPAAGESLIQAQSRSRVLVPTNQPSTIFSFYPNQNLGALLTLCQGAGGQLLDSMNHPGRQNMQFSAFYVSDPASPKNRLMIFLGSEDRSGYVKDFQHGVRTWTTGGAENARLHWMHTYYPPFSDVYSNPSNPTPTRNANTFIAPYPAHTGVLRAQSDDWWYDACEHYRTTVVESSGLNGGPIGGAKLEANAGVSALAKAPALASLNIYTEPYMTKSMEVHNAHKTVLSSPYLQPVQYYHTHTCAPDLFQPANPPTFYTGFKSMVTTARAQGINCSIYLYGPNIDHALGWPIPPFDSQRRTITGMDPTGCLPNGSCFTTFDHGRLGGQRWLMDNVYLPVRAAVPGLTGVYLDSLVGGGPYLAYDHPNLTNQEHAAHGGNYATQGRRASLEYARATLRNQGANPDAAVLSEGIEEFLQDRLDFTQHGWSWIPQHLALCEPDLMKYGPIPDMTNWVSSVPLAARNLTPPLWETVYHAYSHAQNVPLMITATPLRTNPVYASTPSSGLLPDEWVDIQCFTRASSAAAGRRSGIFSYFGGAYHDLPTFRLVNNALVPGPHDPQSTGQTIYNFVKTLHVAEERAFGGRFLMYGDSLRPLAVDFQDPAVAMVLNPTKALIDRGINQLFGFAEGIFPEAAEGSNPPVAPMIALGGYSAFNVPKVASSVWRSPEGDLGIVLINWTGQAASFRATFDPALYGVANPSNYRIDQLTHSGQVTRSFSNLSGSVSLDASAAPFGPVPLGLLPARSISIFLVK